MEPAPPAPLAQSERALSTTMTEIASLAPGPGGLAIVLAARSAQPIDVRISAGLDLEAVVLTVPGDEVRSVWVPLYGGVRVQAAGQAASPVPRLAWAAYAQKRPVQMSPELHRYARASATNADLAGSDLGAIPPGADHVSLMARSTVSDSVAAVRLEGSDGTNLWHIATVPVGEGLAGALVRTADTTANTLVGPVPALADRLEINARMTASAQTAGSAITVNLFARVRGGAAATDDVPLGSIALPASGTFSAGGSANGRLFVELGARDEYDSVRAAVSGMAAAGSTSLTVRLAAFDSGGELGRGPVRNRQVVAEIPPGVYDSLALSTDGVGGAETVAIDVAAWRACR